MQLGAYLMQLAAWQQGDGRSDLVYRGPFGGPANPDAFMAGPNPFAPATSGLDPFMDLPHASGGDPLASGILATAQALGMDPADLATIISYETGGTFDPTQAGPTTQWGQHRGLIQFGEPQAQEYGVDWNDPLGSQLGPDGAIARYFRQNGWQPGMGLLDAYSIVNAGGPGRYDASDAGNGGAPGTVADKVREQMGGHRENAMRLLGGAGFAGNGPQRPAGAPPAFGQGQTSQNALAALASRTGAAAPPPPPSFDMGQGNALAGFQMTGSPLPIYGFGPGQNPFYVEPI